MAKYQQSVIGIEITEDAVHLVQFVQEDDAYSLSKVQTISIPPRSIMNGQITDVEMISEQISKVIEDEGFSSDQVVISLNDKSFLKRLDIFSVLTANDLIMDLEMNVSSEFYFQQREFNMGYQIYKETFEDREPAWQSVLYAALPADTVSTLEDLVESLGCTLVSIDLVSLSVLRAIMWGGKLDASVSIVCYVETDYMDVNFIYKGHVVLSHIFRRNLSEVIDDDYFVDSYLVGMKQLMVQYSNLYPSYDSPTELIYFSRHSRVDVFFEQCGALLGVNVTEYKFDKERLFLKEDISADKLTGYARTYLPSIGLGLKFFEKIDKTLSITKVKKQLAPIFDRKQVIIFSAVFAAVLFLGIGTNMYFSQLRGSIDQDLKTTKNRIKAIQAGEFVGRQKKIDALKESIGFFGESSDQLFSKEILFQEVVSGLPVDITFKSFKISQKSNQYFVRIEGDSFFQESIYTFYNSLKSQFTDVNLASIKSTYGKDGEASHSFQVSFFWGES